MAGVVPASAGPSAERLGSNTPALQDAIRAGRDASALGNAPPAQLSQQPHSLSSRAAADHVVGVDSCTFLMAQMVNTRHIAYLVCGLGQC